MSSPAVALQRLGRVNRSVAGGKKRLSVWTGARLRQEAAFRSYFEIITRQSPSSPSFHLSDLVSRPVTSPPRVFASPFRAVPSPQRLRDPGLLFASPLPPPPLLSFPTDFLPLGPLEEALRTTTYLAYFIRGLRQVISSPAVICHMTWQMSLARI